MGAAGCSVALKCPGVGIHAAILVLFVSCLAILLRVTRWLRVQPHVLPSNSSIVHTSLDSVVFTTQQGSSAAESSRKIERYSGLVQVILPRILYGLEAIQLWAVAVACMVADAPSGRSPEGDNFIASAVVAFIDLPPLLVGCQSQGSEPSIVLGWLFPHLVLTTLLLLALGQGVGVALYQRCKRRETDAARLLEENQPPLCASLKLNVNDALAAHMLQLRATRIAMARQAFRGIRCALTDYGPKQPDWTPTCGSTWFWMPFACVTVLLNVVVPSAVLWHFMPIAADGRQQPHLRYGWAKMLTFALPCEVWAKVQLITSLLIVGCVEVGTSCTRSDVRQRWFVGAQAVFLGEIFFMVGRRWQLRSASVFLYVIMRSAVLFAFHLLVTAPSSDVLHAAEVLSVAAVVVMLAGMVLAYNGMLESLKQPWKLPEDGKDKVGSSGFQQNAQQMPKMALHIMTASHNEFHDFCGRLSHDDKACLEVAASIVKRRLCTAPLVSSVASLSAQWAFGVASTSRVENKLDMFSFQSLTDGANRFIGSDLSTPGPDKHSSDLYTHTPVEEIKSWGSRRVRRLSQSQSCGALLSGFTNSKSATEIVPSIPGAVPERSSSQRLSKSCYELVAAPPMGRRPSVNSRSYDDLLRCPGPLVKSMQEGGSRLDLKPGTVFDPSTLRLPSSLRPPTNNPKSASLPLRANQQENASSSTQPPSQPPTPKGTLAQKQDNDCSDAVSVVTSATTISEQGQHNLAKAALASIGIQAITGEDAKASGQNWVCKEGEQSKALFQRYTHKANPGEKRLSQAELAATRMQAAGAAPLATPTARKSWPQVSLGDDILCEAITSSADSDVLTNQGDVDVQKVETDSDKNTRLFDNLVREMGLIDSSDPKVISDPPTYELLPLVGVEELTASEPVWSHGSESSAEAVLHDEGCGSEPVANFSPTSDGQSAAEWAKWRQRKEARKERMAARSKKAVETSQLKARSLKQRDSKQGRHISKKILDAASFQSEGSDRSFTSNASNLSRYSLDTGIFQLSQNYSQRTPTHGTGDTSGEACATAQQWEVPQESCRRSWGA